LISGLNDISEGSARLLGNSSFASISLPSSTYPILYYTADLQHSTFATEDEPSNIQPTVSYLVANPSVPAGVRLISITKDGKATYSGGTTTGSNTPTVGGGKDFFITAVDGGINIAVAAPQMVQVVSATGNILYNGYVTDNVNVPLPINGIYVIKGETEVQKIFF
jgi:hypothetical protein